MCADVHVLSKLFKRHSFTQDYSEKFISHPLVDCGMANWYEKVFFLWCALWKHNPLAF
jgi:hypothetical protein